MGLMFCPLRDLWVDKLTQIHILIKQKPIRFWILGTYCHGPSRPEVLSIQSTIMKMDNKAREVAQNGTTQPNFTVGLFLWTWLNQPTRSPEHSATGERELDFVNSLGPMMRIDLCSQLAVNHRHLFEALLTVFLFNYNVTRDQISLLEKNLNWLKDE